MNLSSQIGVLLLCTGATLLPESAHGRSIDARFLIGPVAGIVSPKGDLRAEAKSGFNAGLSAEVMIGKHFSVGMAISHSRFGRANQVIPAGYGDPVDSFQIGHVWLLSQIGVHGTCYLNSSWPLSPFIRVAENLCLTRRKYTSYHLPSGRDDRETYDRLAMGLSIGTGVSCRVSSRVRAMLEAAYNEFDRLDEINLWSPNTVYPALNYWSLNLGLAFYLGQK